MRLLVNIPQNMKPHVCRCCLSEACYKDISNEYIYEGQKEVYSEMLLNTLNINISYQEDGTRLICEDCIVRLRDAAAFRRQVEQAEQTISQNIVTAGTELLTKLMDYKDDFIDHITGEFDDDLADHIADEHSSDEIAWQDDGVQDNEGEVFVIKLEPEEDVTLGSQIKNKLINKNLPKCSVQNRPLLMSKNKGDIVKKNKDNKKKESEKRKRIKPISQLNLKENSLKLINNSNICLFESLKTKFRCFYCKNSYLTISELRDHSTSHSNPSYLKMCINRLQGMSYKNVDISNLMCKNCSQPLKDLTELKNHLVETHNVEFSSESATEHLLIPYRLENGFDCVLCDLKFNTFFRLSIHMNSHYTNHVCEICGVSYINRLSLRMHVSSIHTEKKCSLCPATFLNNYSRVKHMRKVHNSSEAKRYCLLCDKTFRYTYMLNEHKIQEHGAKRQLSKCQECGKTFLSPVNLRTHVRSVHIKERNHPCVYCGMSFFTSCDQRRHERTHQDIRMFACSYCDGRFKSKDSLRRHLKRQHGNLYS